MASPATPGALSRAPPSRTKPRAHSRRSLSAGTAAQPFPAGQLPPSARALGPEPGGRKGGRTSRLVAQRLDAGSSAINCAALSRNSARFRSNAGSALVQKATHGSARRDAAVCSGEAREASRLAADLTSASDLASQANEAQGDPAADASVAQTCNGGYPEDGEEGALRQGPLEPSPSAEVSAPLPSDDRQLQPPPIAESVGSSVEGSGSDRLDGAPAGTAVNLVLRGGVEVLELGRRMSPESPGLRFGFKSMKNYRGKRFLQSVDGTPSDPIFTVRCEETGQIWEAESPPAVWRLAAASSGFRPSYCGSRGVEFFGLSHPSVVEAMAEADREAGHAPEHEGDGGVEFFGLTHPSVVEAMAEADGDLLHEREGDGGVPVPSLEVAVQVQVQVEQQGDFEKESEASVSAAGPREKAEQVEIGREPEASLAAAGPGEEAEQMEVGREPEASFAAVGPREEAEQVEVGREPEASFAAVGPREEVEGSAQVDASCLVGDLGDTGLSNHSEEATRSEEEGGSGSEGEEQGRGEDIGRGDAVESKGRTLCKVRPRVRQSSPAPPGQKASMKASKGQDSEGGGSSGSDSDEGERVGRRRRSRGQRGRSTSGDSGDSSGSSGDEAGEKRGKREGEQQQRGGGSGAKGREGGPVHWAQYSSILETPELILFHTTVPRADSLAIIRRRIRRCEGQQHNPPVSSPPASPRASVVARPQVGPGTQGDTVTQGNKGTQNGRVTRNGTVTKSDSVTKSDTEIPGDAVTQGHLSRENEGERSLGPERGATHPRSAPQSRANEEGRGGSGSGARRGPGDSSGGIDTSASSALTTAHRSRRNSSSRSNSSNISNSSSSSSGGGSSGSNSSASSISTNSSNGSSQGNVSTDGRDSHSTRAGSSTRSSIRSSSNGRDIDSESAVPAIPHHSDVTVIAGAQDGDGGWRAPVVLSRPQYMIDSKESSLAPDAFGEGSGATSWQGGWQEGAPVEGVHMSEFAGTMERGPIRGIGSARGGGRGQLVLSEPSSREPSSREQGYRLEGGAEEPVGGSWDAWGSARALPYPRDAATAGETWHALRVPPALPRPSVTGARNGGQLFHASEGGGGGGGMSEDDSGSGTPGQAGALLRRRPRWVAMLRAPVQDRKWMLEGKDPVSLMVHTSTRGPRVRGEGSEGAELGFGAPQGLFERGSRDAGVGRAGEQGEDSGDMRGRQRAGGRERGAARGVRYEKLHQELRQPRVDHSTQNMGLPREGDGKGTGDGGTGAPGLGTHATRGSRGRSISSGNGGMGRERGLVNAPPWTLVEVVNGAGAGVGAGLGRRKEGTGDVGALVAAVPRPNAPPLMAVLCSDNTFRLLPEESLVSLAGSSGARSQQDEEGLAQKDVQGTPPAWAASSGVLGTSDFEVSVPTASGAWVKSPVGGWAAPGDAKSLRIAQALQRLNIGNIVDEE